MGVRASEIEADFQRYYRIHLGDLFTGRLTLRRFSVLLFGLPPGAVTWRAQGGELAWSTEAHAALMVRHAIQQFQEGFAKNPKDVPLPKPPEWGHLERAAERAATEDRRAKKFIERYGAMSEALQSSM